MCCACDVRQVGRMWLKRGPAGLVLGTSFGLRKPSEKGHVRCAAPAPATLTKLGEIHRVQLWRILLVDRAILRVRGMSYHHSPRDATPYYTAVDSGKKRSWSAWGNELGIHPCRC